MSSRLLTVRRLPALLIILLISSTALAEHDAESRRDRGARSDRTTCDVTASTCDIAPAPRHRSRGFGWNGWQRRIGRWANAQIDPGRQWVKGHYEWTYETVCVEPAHYEKQWVPPVTETRYQPCGTPYTVVVREGYYQNVWVPARYEQRRVRVWVPGAWSTCSGPYS